MFLSCFGVSASASEMRKFVLFTDRSKELLINRRRCLRAGLYLGTLNKGNKYEVPCWVDCDEIDRCADNKEYQYSGLCQALFFIEDITNSDGTLKEESQKDVIEKYISSADAIMFNLRNINPERNKNFAEWLNSLLQNTEAFQNGDCYMLAKDCIIPCKCKNIPEHFKKFNELNFIRLSITEGNCLSFAWNLDIKALIEKKKMDTLMQREEKKREEKNNLVLRTKKRSTAFKIGMPFSALLAMAGTVFGVAKSKNKVKTKVSKAKNKNQTMVKTVSVA